MRTHTPMRTRTAQIGHVEGHVFLPEEAGTAIYCLVAAFCCPLSTVHCPLHLSGLIPQLILTSHSYYNGCDDRHDHFYYCIFISTTKKNKNNINITTTNSNNNNNNYYYQYNNSHCCSC